MQVTPKFKGPVEAVTLTEDLIGEAGDILIISDGKPMIITKREYDLFFCAGGFKPERKRRAPHKLLNDRPNLKFEVLKAMASDNDAWDCVTLGKALDYDHQKISALLCNCRMQALVHVAGKKKHKHHRCAVKTYVITSKGRQALLNAQEGK